MQRMVLQVLLGISGLLMLSQFGAPALIFGATGPGPLGNRWLAEGNTATLLLDSDLRFLGAMMLGLGAIFFWTHATKSNPSGCVAALVFSLRTTVRAVHGPFREADAQTAVDCSPTRADVCSID